jgi:hypothetical protein
MSDEDSSYATDDSAHVYTHMPANPPHPTPHTQPIAAALSHITSSFMYWALLLEPVDDVANTYKRVGLAMLYPHAFTALGVHPAEFDVV